ncbi:MAG: FAD-binding domain-containing protein [Nitrospiraceae bacterium]
MRGLVWFRRDLRMRPLPAKLIHEPHLMSLQEQRRLGCMIGTNYPLPIVDHLKARNEYLELGKQAKATHI